MGHHIKEEIKTAFVPPEPKGREKFLSGLRFPKMTFSDFMVSQIGYIRKRMWAASLAVLSAAAGVACIIPEDAKGILWMMAAVMPFLAMLTASEISRSGIFGMSEIEAGCRFSLTQVVGARMIILGVCNFLVIMAVSVISGIFTPFSVARSALYIFTPYITVSGCSLIIFNKTKGEEGGFLSAAVALLVSILGVVTYNRDIFNGRFTTLCLVAVCIGGALTAAAQMKKILYGKELYLWN